MFVVVPNELRDAIYERVDEELKKHPELRDQRESIYQDILKYYDEHGSIPDFSVEPKK